MNGFAKLIVLCILTDILLTIHADKILRKIGEGLSYNSCLGSFLMTICSLAKPHIYVICHPGTFGQVLECWDREMREVVAVKIIRSIKKYRDAAMIEIDVLEQLGRHNRHGNGYIPFYFSFFIWFSNLFTVLSD